MEFRNNILHLILTEKHFCKEYLASETSMETLYLAQLKKLINEKYKKVTLQQFLEDIAEYCSDYYAELCIKVQVNKKDNKEFSFKQASLTETLLHMFTLIIRTGRFDIEEKSLVIKGSFVNKNYFPTISIEASLSNSSLRSLGWELGPDYVYTGFLSIYLLAKENNLVFNIKQREDKIIFLLNPIDKEELQEISEVHLNLI
jgi:hypothetical protein